MNRDNEPSPAPRSPQETESDHHSSGNLRNEITLIVFVAVMLLLNVTGLFTQIFGLDTALIVALVGGYGLFWDSFKQLTRGRLGGDLAVTLAAFAALCIGQFAAAAEVVLIMLIGRALEAFAVGRTRNAIAALRKLIPQTVTVLRGEREIAYPLEGLRVGDRIRVRPGERIPADGVIRRGQSAVDVSALTGEALPLARAEGETVHAGTLNVSGLLEIEATAVGANTTLAQIVREVAEAESRKAPTQRLADRQGGLFVFLLLCIGGLTFAVWFFALHASSEVALTRMASALIIACPCALLLATPTGIAAAIGRLARGGVLAKGGATVEALSQVNCFLFDKTGTLTQGHPAVVAIEPFDGYTEEEALQMAATAEQGSTHPLARCLLVAWAQRKGTLLPLDSAEERFGQGVVAQQGRRRLVVGSRCLLDACRIALSAEAEQCAAARQACGQTVLYVAVDDALVALIALADTVRPEARSMLDTLRAMGIEDVEMLTGDADPVAAVVAHEVGITTFQAGLLPAEKAARVRERQAEGYRVAFVGDGVNDALALTVADVGIALGHDGVDIAVEAADLVLVSDDLTRLPEAVAVSRCALQLIERNLLLYGIGLNVLSVLVSATGGLAWFGGLLQARWPALFGGMGRDLSPLLAAILHQVASLLVIGSALRLLSRRVDLHAGNALPCAHRESVFEQRKRRLMEFTPVEFLVSAGELFAEGGRAHRRQVGALIGVSVLGFWLLTGFYTVPAGQRGVVQRFGRQVAVNVLPGLRFRFPWPVESVTTVDVSGVRRVEIGFRTVRTAPSVEAVPSEWNSPHRGTVQRVAEESLLLTGDAYLADANLTLQYRIGSAERFLFHVADAEALLRQAGEAALRRAVERTSLETLLTTGRSVLEDDIRRRIQEDCDRSETGLVVLEARLLEVHPPQEVVAAYRDVSSATEEKATEINQAEAYRNETIPLAKGLAAQNVAQADSYTFQRTHRASGDADRFLQTLLGFRQGAAVNAQRIYLETVEQALAPPGKYVFDSHGGGRRQLWLSDSPVTGVPAPSSGEPPIPFPPPVEQ